MSTVVTPRADNPFNPVLTSSEALVLSEEQKRYIKEVLSICSSDQQFADKAYLALQAILTGGSVVVPEVTSLNPGAAIIGEPSFDIHVLGTGFTPESIIVFNGFEEPTTFVSDTELTTGVNMPLWLAPAVVPVAVLSKDGVLSNPIDFEFTL